MNGNEAFTAQRAFAPVFYPEQGPAYLDFACALNGLEPVLPPGEFAWFEIGCGAGLTANTLAATNPRGRFFANDANPVHVVTARELAEAAGLENITFLERDLAALAAGADALPPLDYVTLNGFYSSADKATRADLVRFLNRYLKPGGIVFLNYDALPGRSNELPLQWLLCHMAEGAGSVDAAARGYALARRMGAANAAYFTKTQKLDEALDALEKGDAEYLPQVYRDPRWHASYHIDVARELAQAKLDFAGSAQFVRAFPACCLTLAQQELLAQIPDPGLRETMVDYLHNTRVREDVYVRGARRMSTARRDACLAHFGVALTSLRPAITLTVAAPAGPVELEPETYLPLLDALEARPHGLSELLALPALAGRSMGWLAEHVALLCASGHASIYWLQTPTSEALATSQRMNLALSDYSMANDQYQVMASPLLGSGVHSGLMQRLVYRELDAEGRLADPCATATRAAQAMQRQGQVLQENGQPLTDTDDMTRLLRPTVEAICARRVPVWRQLGML